MDRRGAKRTRELDSAGVALYKAVKTDLLKRMMESNMAAHERLPSEGDIAREYGVSKMVSKMALNALEEEGYIYRRPRSGSYMAERVPSGAEDAGLKPHVLRNQFIGVIVPQFDPYCTEIVAGLERHFLKLGYNILLRVSYGCPQTEENALYELAHLQSIAGIVLYPTNRRFCGDQLLRMQLARYPIVLIDTIFRELSLDSVSHDHYKGAFDMTNYLLDMNHRKICFLTSTILETYSRQERVRGFQNAILGRDMIFDKEMVRELSDNETEQEYRDFVKNLSDTTCVFCGNDYIAKEVLTHAQAMGLRVPEDLSLAGYTDNPLLSFMSIGLTTVRQPINRFSSEVAALLTRRIENPSKEIESIKIDTEVIERESVRRVLLNET